MDAPGPVTGLPAPPGPRELPDLPRHRRELVAMIAAGRPAARGPRWAIPLAAAAAVIAIAVTAAALFPLLGHRTAPAGASGHGTAPGPPVPAARCTAPAGTQCEHTERYTVGTPVRALAVSDDVGTVTVTGSSRRSVLVTERQFYRGLPPQSRHSVSGGQLTLGYTCRSRDCGVSYDIQVPRSMRVQVSTGTGAIWLRSLAGPADATADVGNVHGQGLAGREVGLRTDVGYISAAFAVAPARLLAKADTGSVTLTVPGGTRYAVTATAGLGAVRVGVPRSASATHVIQASADVGAVTITAR
jgi:hypothetical protein